MTIRFDGYPIADTHGPLIVGSAEIPVRRVKYWDVDGLGEIVGRKGGRQIVCTVLVHDGYTKFSDFLKQIEHIEDKLGVHGKLEETGVLKRTFKNVTFDGFDPIPLAGQEEPGPLQDVGVLTRTASNGSETADNGFFAAYFLRFFQLKTT